MINILIDSSKISALYPNITQADVNKLKTFVVRRLTSNFYERWMAEAGRKLNSTRSIYQKSLVVVDEGKFSGAVMLVNKFPNMIESGCSAFDMKAGFLASSKVKFDKDGKAYITIPLRFATPGAVGESEMFSAKMPVEIYDIVKDKPANIQNGEGKRSSGISLSDLKNVPDFLSRPKVRPEIALADKKFEAYENKHSIYQGISKFQDSVTGQNTYKSFRRVSLNSDPNSWIYPGLTAKNISDSALSKFDVDREVEIAQNIWMAQYLNL